jgi:hypothetical protein
MSNIQRKLGFPAEKGVGYAWTSGTAAPRTTAKGATKTGLFCAQQILKYSEK